MFHNKIDPFGDYSMLGRLPGNLQFCERRLAARVQIRRTKGKSENGKM